MNAILKTIRSICFAAIAVSIHGVAQNSVRPPYSVVRTSFYVPSFDGTRVAIDLYRPAVDGKPAPGKFPAVYVQTRKEFPGPAGSRDKFQGISIEEIVRSGYAWIGQDRRGTGASFGMQSGFITADDAMDGKTLIEWITHQPWSDGKVAMLGGSNHGEIQYSVAALHPSGLVAINPAVATPDFYTQLFLNGVPELPYGFMGNVTASPCSHKDEPGIPVDDDTTGAEAKAAAAEHACNLTLLDQYFLGMSRDDWNDRTLNRPGIDNSPIYAMAKMKDWHPLLYVVAGWYDPGTTGELVAHTLWGGKILIGPWGHGGTIFGKPQGFPDLPNATLDVTAAHLAWLDATLKGKMNSFSSQPAVRFYTMNAPPGKEWQDASTWPPPGARHEQLSFAPGGDDSRTSRHVQGKLLLNATPGLVPQGVDTFAADYTADMFDGNFHGTDRDWPGDMTGGIDSKGAAYTSDPLRAPLQVTGAPTARLWVRANAGDTDLFIFLEDVSQDGRSRFVALGAIRLSRRATAQPAWPTMGLPYHRDYRADRETMVANKDTMVELALSPTSYVFREGHQLRVSITTSAGKNFQSLAFFPAPQISILRGGARGSSVDLPVMTTSGN